MKSNLAKKIADQHEDLIPMQVAASEIKPVSDAPPAVLNTTVSDWLKNIEKDMPAHILMMINSYMVRLKGAFHDTAESFNAVAIMIGEAVNDPSLEGILAYLQHSRVHPQSYLLTKFIERTPEADKYLGINQVKEETAAEVNVTVDGPAPPVENIPDRKTKETDADKSLFGKVSPAILLRQVKQFFSKPFHLNLDFMSLADSPSNVMDLESLLSQETVGRISPHSSGFFNDELMVPTLNGSRRIDPTEGKRPRRKVPNITADAINLQPGEIEVELPLHNSAAIPLPNDYEIVAVVGDKPLEIIEPDAGLPCITSLTRTHLHKNLHFIIRRRGTPLVADFKVYQSTEEEKKAFGEHLPLPEKITKNQRPNLNESLHALQKYFFAEFFYVCDPRLGKFISKHHDEMAMVIDGLKVGHCSILSWAAAVYLRQLGHNAVIVNSSITNDEGSAFRIVGHARVAIKDDDGSLLFFDPTVHCKIAKGLTLSDVPDKAFGELEKKFARAKSPEEKKQVLADFRETYIHKTPKGYAPPGVGSPPDEIELHEEQAKLLELIQRAMPDYPYRDSLLPPEAVLYDGERVQNIDFSIGMLRSTRQKLSMIHELLQDPLNCDLYRDDLENKYPHDTPLTFDIYERKFIQHLIVPETPNAPRNRNAVLDYVFTSRGSTSNISTRGLGMGIVFKTSNEHSDEGPEDSKLYNQRNIRFACKDAMGILMPVGYQPPDSFLGLERRDKWKEFFSQGRVKIISETDDGERAQEMLRFLMWLGLVLAVKVGGLKDPGPYESHEKYEWAKAHAEGNLLKLLVECGISPSPEDAQLKLKEAIDGFARFLQPYPWSKSPRKEVQGMQGGKRVLMNAAREYGVGKIKKRFRFEYNKKSELGRLRSYFSKMHLKNEPLSLDEEEPEFADYDPNLHDATDIDMSATQRSGKYIAKVNRLKPSEKKLHVFFDADVVHPNSNAVFDLYGKFRVALEGLAQYARLRKVKAYVTSSSLDYLEVNTSWSDDQLDLIAMWLCKGDHENPHPPGIRTSKGMPKNLLLISSSDGTVNSFRYGLKGKTNFNTTSLNIYPHLRDPNARDDSATEE